MSEEISLLEDFNGTNTNDFTEPAGIFPVVTNVEEMGQVLPLDGIKARLKQSKEIWGNMPRDYLPMVQLRKPRPQQHAYMHNDRKSLPRQNWVSPGT